MAAFDPRRFHEHLATAAIGRFFLYRQVTETTMTLARREADEGAPHGTLVLAEEQTAGRGRRGRSFLSPPGENLYFTLVLRLPAEVHRQLPLAVPVAVCDACRDEGADARLKWPNDTWVGERKVSGMLIDAEITPGGAVAFPGIGVNVNGDPTLAPELRDIATSLRRELGRAVDRERLLANICNRLEVGLAAPPAELGARYRELSIVLGRRVLVTPGAGEPFEALAEGIATDGTLVVRLADGRQEAVKAADVSLRPL